MCSVIVPSCLSRSFQHAAQANIQKYLRNRHVSSHIAHDVSASAVASCLHQRQQSVPASYIICWHRCTGRPFGQTLHESSPGCDWVKRGHAVTLASRTDKPYGPRADVASGIRRTQPLSRPGTASKTEDGAPHHLLSSAPTPRSASMICHANSSSLRPAAMVQPYGCAG